MVLGERHKRDNHDIAPDPRLKVTYTVKYGTGLDGDSDLCGRHYAQSFLQTFINLDTVFTARCQSPDRRWVTVSVTIDTVAMVRIFTQEV